MLINNIELMRYHIIRVKDMRNLVRPTGSQDIEIEKMIDVLAEGFRQDLEDLVAERFPDWPKASPSELIKDRAILSTFTINADGSIQLHRLL